MFGLLPEFEIDVPFERRHQCWFCGEPSKDAFLFPHNQYLVIDCPHPRLVVPSCSECFSIAMSAKVSTIWQVFDHVKQVLVKRYQKDLAIGLNWTEQELAESEFETGNFAGFQQSAWFMYQVARERVNFQAWPIVYHGNLLEPLYEKERFCFDGVTYPSIDDAIKHYSFAFDIKREYLQQTVAKVGIERFAYAVRYCRALVGATPQEMRSALKVLD